MCKTNYIEPEWGFPKGRRNYQEKDIMCVIREFEEETGYTKNDIMVINNILPLEEIFTGSNYKSYKHRYYLAQVNENIKPIDKFQESEVSCIEWKTINEIINIIRNYNLEKIDTIINANKILTKYTLYN